MCFWKRKKPEPINSKYHVGEWVRFRYKGELNPGYIYAVHKDNDDNVIYDVQIGGECPVVISGISEDKIIKK